MPRSIDVAVLPAEARALGADCFVVVDVLRATTTIATLFVHGLEDLVVMSDIEAARRRAAQEGRLLFGEVHGLKPAGFDHGNSPIEAAGANVAGRGAVLFTTNGTAALCGVAGSGAVATGALSNLVAVARYAAGFEHVVVVCAGNARGLTFSLEDFAAGGAICRAVVQFDPARHTGDAANLAMGLDTAAAISQSQHAQITRQIGLSADINFALQADTSHALPFVTECGDGWAVLRDAARTAPYSA